MRDLSLYEKKIINDEEFPVQIVTNHIRRNGVYFPAHWHEHIELHYILEGQGMFYCNQKPYYVDKGSLLIINSYELHEGISQVENLEALVLIFKIDEFSKEVADFNAIFQSLIKDDASIGELMEAIYQEQRNKSFGYKLAMKGKIYELITYLLRNYVVENLTDKENMKRTQNLTRLNTVLDYIEKNYADVITIAQLAGLIHISEYRFCHLFKESLGNSPLNYMIEVRLKAAHRFLEQREMTISEIAATVGFQDYNNFGRLFRKHYGYAPSHVWEI